MRAANWVMVAASGVLLCGCTRPSATPPGDREVPAASVDAPVRAEASAATPPPATAAPRVEAPPAEEQPASAASANGARFALPEGGDFVAASGPAAAPADAAPLSTEEQRRYDGVARRLVEAMNSEDQAAYRALHTDEGWNASIDWWRDMFARQRARFGSVVRAYPCVRGALRFPGFGYQAGMPNGATFIVVFEENVGGALTFELNEQDQIVASEVYLKQEMASYAPPGVVPLFEKK